MSDMFIYNLYDLEHDIRFREGSLSRTAGIICLFYSCLPYVFFSFKHISYRDIFSNISELFIMKDHIEECVLFLNSFFVNTCSCRS